jgi:uncharacterized membrane protein YedE/YeeE
MSHLFKSVIVLISGILFGFGLMFSGMTDPNKVINFLNLFGHWDPSLALVMVGALFVYGGVYWTFLHKKQQSLYGDVIQNPNSNPVTKKLLIGAVMFGIGWGLTGICPGPAIANIASGDIKIYAFIVIMLIGMKTSNWLKAKV